LAEVAIARATIITASFSTDSTNHGLFAYMNFINAPIRAITCTVQHTAMTELSAGNAPKNITTFYGITLFSMPCGRD
jgi:hypothetical protein